ncbi:MAG: hypothetical protein U0166_26160 [Acidobacteriota bacterium]
MSARGIVVMLVLVSAGVARAAGPASQVVGLEVTYQEWDQRRPWAKRDPSRRNASAVVLAGPSLLTTAEMVGAATLVKIEKFGRSTQAVAHVAFVDPDVNLALLSVDDPRFFDGLTPVTLAPATPMAEALRTIRWNDQQLESAATRVKRVEVDASLQGSLEHVFLEVQTDLTGGGWSEPVFRGDQLVGLTVSQEDDQRARVIPVEVLSLFCRRARAPEYARFPVLGAEWESNADPALAAFLGQAGEPSGIIIRKVPWGGSACGVLEPMDVLLAIDGVPIDAEGFYPHPHLGRLLFPHLLVERHAAGDVVPVKVLRAGHVLDLRMTLRAYPSALDLVPQSNNGGPPYAVVGGLVFRELDVPYLASWGSEWTEKAPAVLRLLHRLDQESQRPDRRRIVVLSSVLPSPYNVGYQDIADAVVESVNERAVQSIGDLVGAFESPIGGFHTITLARTASRREIVLDAGGLSDATAGVLAAYGVPRAVRLPSGPLPDIPCASRQ